MQAILETLATIAELHDEAVALWHRECVIHSENPMAAAILEQHRKNYELWHLEDTARKTDIPAEEIAATKRSIDKVNQLRNDLIEKVDILLLGALINANDAAPLHSETTGMMIDRLSILSLKLYHTEEELRRTDVDAIHLARNAERKRILLEQRTDLKACLLRAWALASRGELRIKVYRQLKMYNDPQLNPELYRGRQHP